ncbi:MAG TPA: CopD family protein, partial [Nitrospiria bacterium]|nr:CopD family protein [Nitrospiria bacterium]
QSNYGQVVAFKVVLTVVAVGLGGFSRFVVLPALRREGNGRTPIEQFRRAIRVEASVVLLVIMVAAVLTQTPPAGNMSLTSGPMIHSPASSPSMDHSHMEHSSGGMAPMDDHAGEQPATPSMD